MVAEKGRKIVDGVMVKLARNLLFLDANFISLLSFTFSIVAAFLIVFELLLLSLLAIFLTGFFDVLDGKIAKTKAPTPFGIWLDPIIDRLSDMAIILGIGFSRYCDMTVSIITVVITFLISYVGTLGLEMKLGRVSGGLVSRADRVIIISLSIILQFFFSDLVYGRYILNWGLLFLLSASVISFLQRLAVVIKKLNEK